MILVFVSSELLSGAHEQSSEVAYTEGLVQDVVGEWARVDATGCANDAAGLGMMFKGVAQKYESSQLRHVEIGNDDVRLVLVESIGGLFVHGSGEK
jgi:hypothetical protein